MSEQVLPIKQKIIETTGITPDDLANIVILYYYGNKFSSYKKRYYTSSSGKSWTEQSNGILLSETGISGSNYTGIRFTQAIDFTNRKYIVSIVSNNYSQAANYNGICTGFTSGDPANMDNDPGAGSISGFNNTYSKWYDLGNNQKAVISDISHLSGNYYSGFFIAIWNGSAISGLLQAHMVL